MPTPASSELLRSFVSQGSEPAFRALVDRYLPLVYSTALRQVGGNTTLAEETAQDVFVILARKCGALVDRPTISSWLFHATRLSAIDKVRREQRRLEREQKACAMEQTNAEPETIDWERTRPLLDSLLGELSRRDQDALFMRFFEGRTFAEIGEKLKIGEDGARLRSNRAVEKINSLLSRRGSKSTSAVLARVLTTQQSGAVPAGLAASTASGGFSGAASAIGGFAATSLIFPIMKTSQIIAGSIALLATMGLGSAFYVAQVSRRDEASIETLREERTALRKEITTLHGRLQTGAAFLTAARKELDTLRASREQSAVGDRPAKPAPPAASASVPSSIADLLNQVDYILAHPELRPAFVSQVVQQLSGSDRRFFKSIGVSVEHEAAIGKEAAEYANTLLNARANRIGGEDFVDLFSAADEYSFNQVKRILGDNAFDQLKQFKSNGRENNTVDHLAAQLYFTDSPLTGQQADQLTQILVQSRFSADDARPVGTNKVAGQRISRAEYTAFREAQDARPSETRIALITDAAIARASGDLPTGTVAALKELQERQITQIQLMPTRPGK